MNALEMATYLKWDNMLPQHSQKTFLSFQIFWG